MVDLPLAAALRVVVSARILLDIGQGTMPTHTRLLPGCVTYAAAVPFGIALNCFFFSTLDLSIIEILHGSLFRPRTCSTSQLATITNTNNPCSLLQRRLTTSARQVALATRPPCQR